MWLGFCLFAVNRAYAPCGEKLAALCPSVRTLSPPRRAYVVKNAVKAACLAALSPVALWTVVGSARGRLPPTALLRTLGSVYAANDVVALARVPLPACTRVHHAVVGTFALANLSLEYDSANVWSNVAVMCSTATLAFAVNVYLAARKVPDVSPRSRWVLACLGLASYAPTFAFNAAWQVRAVLAAAAGGEWPPSVLAYAALASAIAADDVVLLRHLWRTASAGPAPPRS